MFFCDNPTLEIWNPDFSTSGLPSPTWTRVKYGGVELCNSLEWTHWATNPVQVQICDVCGTAGCASGGYVHVSALGEIVLWTMPRREMSDAIEGKLFEASGVARRGAIAFPNSVWTSLHAAALEVPETAVLPRSDGESICDAWIVNPPRLANTDDVIDRLRALARPIHWMFRLQFDWLRSGLAGFGNGLTWPSMVPSCPSKAPEQRSRSSTLTDPGRTGQRSPITTAY